MSSTFNISILQHFTLLFLDFNSSHSFNPSSFQILHHFKFFIISNSSTLQFFNISILQHINSSTLKFFLKSFETWHFISSILQLSNTSILQHFNSLKFQFFKTSILQHFYFWNSQLSNNSQEENKNRPVGHTSIGCTC